MTEKKQPVKIQVSVLKEQVENGMKRAELAEYYGISEVQMAKALKQVGIRIRKFHAPAFDLVEDEPEMELSQNYVMDSKEEEEDIVEDSEFVPQLTLPAFQTEDNYKSLYE